MSAWDLTDEQNQALLRMPRHNEADRSTITCVCGRSFTWAGSDNRLAAFMVEHTPHMNAKTRYAEVTIALRVPNTTGISAADTARTLYRILNESPFIDPDGILQIDGYDEEHAKLIRDAVGYYLHAMRTCHPGAPEVIAKLAAIESHMKRRLPQAIATSARPVNYIAKTVLELELETGGSVIVRVGDAPNGHPIYLCKASGKALRQQVCPEHVHQDAGDLVGYDDSKYTGKWK